MNFRKYMLATVLALSLGASAFGQTSYDFGVKGGFSANMMPGTTAILYDQFEPNIGFQGGLFSTFYLSDNIISQVELLYARKGVRTVNHTPEALGDSKDIYARHIHYLQLPLLIGWDSLGGSSLRIMTGPEPGYCLGNHIRTSYGDKKETHFEDDDFMLNSFNLAWAAQATYFITSALGLDVKFDYGITPTFKKDTHDKGHNAGLQVGLCYRFGY